MPRKKAVLEPGQPAEEPQSLRKRSRQELEAIPESDLETTPVKRQRSSGRYSPLADDTESDTNTQSIAVGQSQESPKPLGVSPPRDDDETPKPTPRRRGRPPKNAAANGNTPTPKAARTANFETPKKNANGGNGFTPLRQAADRSAHRKSARALIEHVVGDDLTDEEEDDDNLARRIFDDASDAEDEDDGAVTGDTSAVEEAATPSKTNRRKSRPRKARSPTPPRDLPPHELYFAQNKPGRAQTSNNTLGSLAMLTHEEYFSIVRENQDRHAGDIEYLEGLHAESFPQWTFELLQGFGICLYGFGSKKKLLHMFATHLHSRARKDKGDKIVMINGYAHNTTMREILSNVGSAIDPTQRTPLAQPLIMVQSIISQLAATDMNLTLVVNSIDAAPLRKPGYHAALAQLAAHPQIHLVASADTPDFSLMWDIGVRSAFNFVFHDCTTFAPYTIELDVVDEVNELLGRNSHHVNGREGVAFVLRSLPENAKNLFRLLVGEVLIAMEDEGNGASDEPTGVEYRMIYNKAVEEFICSSEMAFRTLLKEFHDHQIITSTKDAIGTELLSLPFRKDELEDILEDLTS